MFLSVALIALQIALSFSSQDQRRAVAFFPPADGGGSMLDSSAGLGEPLNVIISGLSSPDVLTDDGFLNYARAIGFSEECFGVHIGTPQTANLGDGNGPQNQIKVLRQDFHNVVAGTCLESIIGGNHFRYWSQNGPSANSGALFLTYDAEQNHSIVPNGYDLGRDQLVSNATGSTSFNGINYYTAQESITGLLPVGSAGINHGIAIDGVVILLTVTVQ